MPTVQVLDWGLIDYAQAWQQQETLYRKTIDLKLANRFWKGYIAENPDVTCIYSGQPITFQNLSLDHFLPWSYVVHDQLWNIIPTPKNINSAKNDRLPSLETYFEGFSIL